MTLMGSEHDAVLILGEVCKRAEAETSPGRWKDLLMAAKHVGHIPRCICHGLDGAYLPMYVARTGNSLVLKRAPGSGPAHHPSCPSYSDFTGGRVTTRRGLIESLPDGSVRVRLDTPITKLCAPQALHYQTADPCLEHRTSADRPSFGLHDLLEFLWLRAGLVGGTGSQVKVKSLGSLYRKLQEELFEVQIGSALASDLIFVPDTLLDADALMRKQADVAQRFSLLQDRCPKGVAPLLFFLGEVRSLFDSKFDSGMRLKGLPDTMVLWVQKSMATSMTAKHGEAITKVLDGSSGDVRLFCLAGVSLSERWNLHVEVCALLETNAWFLKSGEPSSFLKKPNNALTADFRASPS